MTGTKWALTTAAREIYFYAKRMDANITRTLMHTQWKVLGSGPYSTLDKLNKAEVLAHLCERYFSLTDAVARYELAAHIRTHNRQLYHDLVLNGLLRERGGDLTRDDEWLAISPSYRSLECPFLIPNQQNVEETETPSVVPLWFRLPYQNGKRPGKDLPWVRFSALERRKLEERYIASVIQGQGLDAESSSEASPAPAESSTTESAEQLHPMLNSPHDDSSALPHYPTVAQWYLPNLENDLLVDQKRHAVTFQHLCPQCRVIHGECHPPLSRKRYGDPCGSCAQEDPESVEGFFAPPPLSMVMRPTMWRFHGPGDEVRRSVWFLDTKRFGLQPYGEESAAVLEDAYLFLKWHATQKSSSHGLDDSLLTVQVASPDGAEQQLVQFTSLTQATAIQKTLGGAISIFKRRVYRGACVIPPKEKKGNDAIDVPNGLEAPTTTEWDDSTSSEVVDEETTIPTPTSSIDSEAVLAVRTTELLSSDLDMTTNCDEDEIEHLVLVVHGIGEMLRTIDVFGMSLPYLSSIIDCCGFLRKNHSEIQNVKTSVPGNGGRVEYLPVEWHEAFALQSQRQPPQDVSQALSLRRTKSTNASVNDISLRTIPQMRAFANDNLLDVLYFMSPEHHDLIVDIVTDEMNRVVKKFCSFTNFKGKVSVIGHSLGSVVTWDILANQIGPGALTVKAPNFEDDPLDDCPETSSPASEDAYIRTPSGLMLSLSEESPERSRCQSSYQYPQLAFDVDNAFMLGSPTAVFLMIRNQRNPLPDDFYLQGCQRVFNIFHPYDPVAYRMEPLLDPRNADVEPKIITHWNGGFRVQYQTKRLWKKLVDETLRTQQSVIDAVEERMVRLGLFDNAIDSFPEGDDYDDDGMVSDCSSDRAHRVVCGQLNGGRRIDYMLQEKEIESANEYVAALAAHSSYWIEKDLSLFVAQEILNSTIEASIADTVENVAV